MPDIIKKNIPIIIQIISCVIVCSSVIYGFAYGIGTTNQKIDNVKDQLAVSKQQQNRTENYIEDIRKDMNSLNIKMGVIEERLKER